VIDEGRSFKIALGIAAARLQSAQTDREGKPQIADRVGVDLLERREPMALVVLVMQKPVLRLTVRIESALERHVGGARTRQRARSRQSNQSHRNQKLPHIFLPTSLKKAAGAPIQPLRFHAVICRACRSARLKSVLFSRSLARAERRGSQTRSP